MKVSPVLLLLCAVCICLSVVHAARIDPMAVLNTKLPPPPTHHTEQTNPAPQSLIAVASTATVDQSAALSAHIAAEAALAVDESILAAASVEDTITEKGMLTAEESALVNKFIPIPSTNIPADTGVPIQYTAPPTRDVLKPGQGVSYPWPEKLQNALNTVSDAAKTKIDQIKRQAKWKDAATKLVNELSLKKNKVSAHVAKLTEEIKGLLGKKKQIQNKQLQDKLVERLEEVHKNLKRVRRQNHNIRKSEAQMLHHRDELAHVLEDIKRSLAILKGLKRERQFPSRGAAKDLKQKLSEFDPDLSFEKEADEVRALQFPDANP